MCTQRWRLLHITLQTYFPLLIGRDMAIQREFFNMIINADNVSSLQWKRSEECISSLFHWLKKYLHPLLTFPLFYPKELMMTTQELLDTPPSHCLMVRNILTPLGSAVLIRYRNALRRQRTYSDFCLSAVWCNSVLFLAPSCSGKKKKKKNLG